MNFIVQPIYFAGGFHCINPSTKMTDVVVTGDAVNNGTNQYRLYETPTLSPSPPIAPDDGAVSSRIYSGSVEFAVSCGVSAILITCEGFVETKENGFDWVEFYVNDDLVLRRESVQFTYSLSSNEYPTPAGYGTYDQGDGTWTRPYDVQGMSGDVTISLSGTPCGNKIRITGSTGDVIANNHVYYDVGWELNP